MKKFLSRLASLFFLVSLSTVSVNANQIKARLSYENTVKISVSFDNVNRYDSMQLLIYKYAFDNDFLIHATKIAKLGSDGSFKFVLECIDHPIYVSLFKDITKNGSRIILLQQYLVEPGDNVAISINIDSTIRSQKVLKVLNNITYIPNYRFKFSGKGSEKFACRYESDLRIQKVSDTSSRIRGIFEVDTNIIEHRYFDIIAQCARETLEKYKDYMSEEAFSILSVDFFSAIELYKMHYMKRYELPLIRDDSVERKVLNKYQDYLERRESNFSNYAKLISSYYSKMVVEKLCIGTKFSVINRGKLTKVVSSIKNKFSGELRDKILVALLLTYSNTGLSSEMFSEAKSSVESIHYKKVLNAAYPNTIWEAAVTNEAKFVDVYDNVVKLSDFKGKIIFMDFWFSGCGSCAIFYKTTLSKLKDLFKFNSKVVFLSVNVDADQSNWINAIATGKYTSVDLINVNTGGSGVNHPIIRQFRISSFPEVLIIGKSGKIYSVYKDEFKGGKLGSLISIINDALNQP